MNKETSVILEMLRHIVNQPNSTQRDLARGLNLSLGKVNYCMKALKEKGYIKINNFKKNPDKISYAYILTPKGIKEKTKLTINFMKRKMIEYEDLKKELANDVKKNEK
ncbi:MarR family EPS-associated transcriptional regulator [Candidatus Pelagibacter sp.]|jgi:EPS-associated MarR family transcriptional regulator|nr:MarR family EPS-associated transcriptional regulator [Candidatus Pelagibacter sp.]